MSRRSPLEPVSACLNGLSWAAALPAAPVIQEKAAEITARPEFQLDHEQNHEARGLLMRVILWLLKPLVWLFESLEGLPDPLRWTITILLSIILLALIVHLVWTFVTAIRGAPLRGTRTKLSQRRLSPEEMEQAADQARSQQDFMRGVRLLFQACLLRIEAAEQKPFRRGMTNRQLLSKYRTTPLFNPLNSFVETIDAKFYGHDLCEEGDYVTCLQEHGRLRTFLESRRAERA